MRLMKNIIKICLLIMSICSTANATTSETPYTPKSGGLPSIDFVKRFGKHCTTHKNIIGRQVFGLCDDGNLCNDPQQYKACYINCIQNRKKEDEKTTYIFGKLAACHNNVMDPTGKYIILKRPNAILNADKEAKGIFDQANLRLNRDKYQVKNVKTVETPADKYQPTRTPGINSTKSINPFSTNCTTHKNALGITTNGVCDSGKQCTADGYKKCYKSCVENRKVDDKTFFVLKQLVKCPIDERDTVLGTMAKDVRDQYRKYELANYQSSNSVPKKVIGQKSNDYDASKDDVGQSYLNALKKPQAPVPPVKKQVVPPSNSKWQSATPSPNLD